LIGGRKSAAHGEKINKKNWTKKLSQNVDRGSTGSSLGFNSYNFGARYAALRKAGGYGTMYRLQTLHVRLQALE